MRKIMSIHEAKTNLYELLRRVAKGDQIFIGRAGAPIAKLVPYSTSPKGRRPGFWRGKVVIANDFDRLPREMERAFQRSKD